MAMVKQRTVAVEYPQVIFIIMRVVQMIGGEQLLDRDDYGKVGRSISNGRYK